MLDLNKTGISRVTCYTASPVETCDRCSAGIKYVSLVVYRDGSSARYGSECINKILDAAPDMRKLYAKNAKRLAQLLDYERILSGPVSAMPRGPEYYGSGLYMIADSKGSAIIFEHYFFHPEFDRERNEDSGRYPVRESDSEYAARQQAVIARSLPKLRAEITRIETFLARVLAKAGQAACAQAMDN